MIVHEGPDRKELKAESKKFLRGLWFLWHGYVPVRIRIGIEWKHFGGKR
jgi:hypothetical protein